MVSFALFYNTNYSVVLYVFDDSLHKQKNKTITDDLLFCPT